MLATGTFKYDVPQSILEAFALSNLGHDYMYQYSWEDIFELYIEYILVQQAGSVTVNVDNVRR